ncbi:MAG: DUF1501 domain-containing protein [Planctomycetes bacterium]|nr:DUF1501 domain-containing protein [Planctomycetota bacterium]
MHDGHEIIRNAVSRRTFLAASGLSFCGLSLRDVVRCAPTAAPKGKAKSTILIWLSGGASHIDTWDMKPDAPVEYRGPFQSIETSAPGIRLCEHLPLTAKQAHHLAIVRSLGHYGRGTGDHHAGYYYNLTGHEPDPTFRQLLNNRRPYATDWPFIGSVVTAKRTPHPYLPSLITLPQKPGHPEYTRPGQFSARLGVENDPVYVLGSIDKPTDFTTPVLTLSGEVTPARLADRRSLMNTLDEINRNLDHAAATTYSKQQTKAFSLLTAPKAKAAFDLKAEPQSLRERYGNTINGMSMLMARRIVEAGVPFVSVFWMESPKLSDLCKSGGGWDTHGSNFSCLKEHLLPEFDRCYSALLGDLHDRGLLGETLVHVNSEMGRMPKIGDPRSGGPKGAGRDHWTHCQSVLFAGGGIRGGQAYGSSDKVAAYPFDRTVAPEDVAHTIYRAMGIDNLEAIDRENRPYNLLPDGAPINGLFSG